MLTKLRIAILIVLITLCIAPQAEAFVGASFFMQGAAVCSYPLPLGSNTVIAAYGLRLLNASYATPTKIIRVQRTSDNTQSDIGTAANNCDLDTNAFNAFCAATTCFVAKWYDQSGNGADASQATFGSMPQLLLNQQNGRPGAVFGGSTHYLTATLPASTAITFAGIIKTGSSIATNAFIMTVGNTTDNRIPAVFSSACVSSSDVAGVAKNGTIACSASTAYRWISTFTNSARQVYLNGVHGTDETTTQAMASETALTIGSGATQLQPWTGTINEMILFAPSLSSTDSATESSMQGSYWGL